MTGAGNGRQIRVGRVLEPGTVIDEAAKTGVPLLTVGLEVVGAHLVDSEYDQ